MLIDGTFIQAALDCKIHIRVCAPMWYRRWHLLFALRFEPLRHMIKNALVQDGLKSQLDGTANPMTTRCAVRRTFVPNRASHGLFRSCVLAELKRLGSRFTGAAVVAKRLQMCEVSAPESLGRSSA